VETSNLDIVYKAFKRNYILVPLEVFGKNPYKTLISTILSARTKDEVTLEASKRLFSVARNLNELEKLEINEIEKLIYPVGFYKTKAKHLHTLAGFHLTRIPKTREELMKLPGVGRKTANLVLNRAFGIPAIAVDTHVHRICNVLGWVKTKNPEETEKELIKIIPESYWPDLNRLFVSIGRQYTTNKKLIEFLKKEKLI
jgi:endonuclease III